MMFFATIRRLTIVLGLVFVLWPGLVFGQVATGCCFNSSGYCLDGLSQAACDSSYSPGSAGTNFYSGQACSTVSQCSATGKCEQSGGVNCQNLQKWQCDAKLTSGYNFFQGQLCGAAAPVGSCCVQPPVAGSTTNDCQDNVDKTTCDAKLGGWYAYACAGVDKCPQATVGAPATTYSNPQPSATIIFNPEVPLPTFAGGPVTGQTIAKYIQAVFVYFIWTVGLLAMFMIVYGGVKWVSAAGNPGRINDARETINNAIIGLIIALTSVLLLNTISPNLTNFNGITIKPVERELLVADNVPGENNEATTGVTKTGKLVQQETSCAVSKKRFAWPVGDSKFVISSSVGPRTCPGCSKWHAGTDFKTDQKTGKPIIAVVTGTIKGNAMVAGEPSVKLFSADGKFYIRYVHLSKSLFTDGTSVQQGAVIGYSGGANPPSTRSTGPHLHLELYEANGDMHDVEPCVLQ